MKWLQSGRRRDLCALLYDAETLRGQQLKTELEAHYGTRIDPNAFYGSLDALVDRGLVAQRTDGIHDVYWLTERGIEGIEAHYTWLTECLDGSSPEPSDEESTQV